MRFERTMHSVCAESILFRGSEDLLWKHDSMVTESMVLPGRQPLVGRSAGLRHHSIEIDVVVVEFESENVAGLWFRSASGLLPSIQPPALSWLDLRRLR